MVSPGPEISFLEGWLSERALRALTAMRARRLPNLVHDRQEIVTRLREARMPTTRAILEAEETVGGLELRVESGLSRKTARLGIFDALSRHDGRLFRKRNGVRLVPFCVGHGELPFYDLYLDERGNIHELDEIAGGGPIAETWQVLLERLAFGTVRVVPPPRVPWMYTPAFAARDIAPVVHARPIDEVSDAYQRLFLGPGVHVSEQDALDDAPAGTTIATTDRSLLLIGLLALHEAHPDVGARLSGDILSTPEEATGKTPILRLPWTGSLRSDTARELLVIGTAEHPRFIAR